MKLAAVIVLGLASAVLTDGLTVAWLAMMGHKLDLTGNYWSFVVVPVVAVVVALQALILWWAYRARPVYYSAVYLATYTVAEIAYLIMLLNPPGDIARYVATILVVGGIVLALFTRIAWRAAPATPSRP